MQKLKTQKGITLIALIITIIVMLILVGVSVTVALNGGLFSTAKQATSGTQLELDKEQLLSAVIGAINNKGKVDFDVLDNNLPEGFIKTGERTYTSEAGNTFIVSENGAITLVEQTEGESGGENSGDEEEPEVTVPTTYKTSIEGLADGVTLIAYEKLEEEITTDIKAAVDAGKISAVIKEGETIAVVPTGYEVSTEDGEDSISGGLVISDTNENEFVWIPVSTDFTVTYTSGDNYSEPTTNTVDKQSNLNAYYGTDYYTLETNFDYTSHYSEMVTSVNKYDGFYIGRYETTIDGTEIGTKENRNVLTVNKSISQTNNKTVRWWGLYDTQRNSNVLGNGDYVQTNMIWGQQWDAMITFFDNNTKDYTSVAVNTVSILTLAPRSSGTTEYTYNGEAIRDEICNIYDLRGNVRDFTAEYSKNSEHRSRLPWTDVIQAGVMQTPD